MFDFHLSGLYTENGKAGGNSMFHFAGAYCSKVCADLENKT